MAAVCWKVLLTIFQSFPSPQGRISVYSVAWLVVLNWEVAVITKWPAYGNYCPACPESRECLERAFSYDS